MIYDYLCSLFLIVKCMNIRKLTIIAGILLFSTFFSVEAQSPRLCNGNQMNATPFCTDTNPYGISYAAGTNSYSSELQYLNSAGCIDLGNDGAANPAWYKMQIGSPGNMNIFMSHSANCDIDYACWGPFTDADMNNMCASAPTSLRNYLYDNLPYDYYYDEYYTYGAQYFSHHPTFTDYEYTSVSYGMNWFYDWYSTPSGKLVDCSSTPSPNEWLHIRNAQVGSWYILYISNWEGCSGSINFTRDAGTSVAHTDCSITAPVSGDEVCEGETATLTANAVAGAVLYRWTGPNNFSQTSAANTITIPNATLQNAGTYTVEVYNGSTYGAPTTCELIVHPTPQLVAQDITICAGDPATLTVSGADTYLWNDGTTSASYTVTPSVTTSYTVTGTNAGGCVATKVVTVNVVSSLEPIITPDTICVGEVATVSPSNGMTFLWSDGSASSSIRPTSADPSSYTVTVTTATGCTGTAVVHVMPAPVADFSASSWTVNIDEPTVQFTDMSTGANEWSWNFGNHSSVDNTSTLQNPQYTYTIGGTFSVTLTVTSDLGCTHTAMHTVTVVGDEFAIFIPSAFTPNEDGKNEGFQPVGRGVQDYEMHIYDRWGNLVFQTKNFSEPWTGLDEKGRALPLDVYTYRIAVIFANNKDKVYKGTVTLVK